MLIVGLTGGIATGKSAVTARFKERGAAIIDFDAMTREVMKPDMRAWKDIVAFFGESVLNDDRTLDRARLGEIVFADPEKRIKLEGFIHPRLFEVYSRRIAEIEQNDPDALVLVDTPLLVEVKLQSMFDKILLVHATREEQMKRLSTRDGLDEEAVLARLSAQMPTEDKIEHAHYVIHNSGSLEDLEREVDKVFELLRGLSGKGA
jgi:dephospho-CoA kinase